MNMRWILILSAFVFLASCDQKCESGKIVKIGRCSDSTFFNSGACRVELDNGIRMWATKAVMMGDSIERCWCSQCKKPGKGRIN